MASQFKAKELQDRLESGLERELGFEIRDGDIVLGNFEDLEMASTVDKKAGQHIKRKVSCLKSFTVWGGRLRKMFCNMFSESSTGRTAAAMLPKQARRTSRKHVTKPFTQIAAPDCSPLALWCNSEM